MKLPYDSNSTSEYLPEEIQNTNSKEYIHPYVHYGSIYNSQAMEAPPNVYKYNEWIEKLWYIYTVEYSSAVKRNEMLPLVTAQMDLEGIMLMK